MNQGQERLLMEIFELEESRDRWQLAAFVALGLFILTLVLVWMEKI